MALATYIIAAGRGVVGQTLGFHAYSLRVDNLSGQWLQEQTTLSWIPPYSLGVLLRVYGTGVALILNEAPWGQAQPAPVLGEYAVAVYSDDYRTENAGTPVREFALVQAVSDLTQGAQPAWPGTGVDRLWADASGNIHHLHSNGTDLILVDSSNAGAQLYPTFDPHYQALINSTVPGVALGGDLFGTIGAARIHVSSGVALWDFNDEVRWNDANHRIWVDNANHMYFDEYGTWLWRSSSNAYATRMSLDASGNLNVTGNITGAGHYFPGGQYITPNGSADLIYAIGSGQHIFRNTASAAAAINCAAITCTTIGASGTITGGSDINATGNVRAGNGNIVLSSSGTVDAASWIRTQGNSFYLGTGGQVILTDGSYFHYRCAVGAYHSFEDTAAGAEGVYAGWFGAATGRNGSYMLTIPNTSGQNGRGIAFAWDTYSSAADKANVAPIDDPLAIVLDPSLHGVTYQPAAAPVDRGAAVPPSAVPPSAHYGFIAEDWLAAGFDTIVSVDEDGQPSGMDYSRIGAITFEGLKELTRRVAALEAKVAA